MSIDIAVVGSLNHDLTVVTPRLPLPGETVLGTSHYSDSGGKGANQAVAAARLGAQVSLIGRVGRDDSGAALVRALGEEGIDTAGVGRDNEHGTGLAVITVNEEAENTIVVSPGANSMITPIEIKEHSQPIREAKVLLTQLEIPLETVMAAVGVATKIVCLNPAPATELPPELLARIDVLIPNRSELAYLAESNVPETLDEALSAVAALPPTGTVVVTLGADGALVIQDGEPTLVPAYPVVAVDPTGAGDAFCGALAHAMSRDFAVIEATRFAVAAGAIAATRRGAQQSMPTMNDVEALLSD